MVRIKWKDYLMETTNDDYMDPFTLRDKVQELKVKSIGRYFELYQNEVISL